MPAREWEPACPAGTRQQLCPAPPPPLLQMQSTYVLQGLHLHIPNIFPNYPSNSSATRGAQAGGYRVRTWCVQPGSGQAGFPLEEEGMQWPLHSPRPRQGALGAQETHLEGGRIVPPPRHPAGMPNCSREFRPVHYPPAALSGLAARLVPPQFHLSLSGPCLSPGLSKPATWHLRAGRRMAYRPPYPICCPWQASLINPGILYAELVDVAGRS